MRIQPFRIFPLLVFIGLLAGCRLEVIVGPGGVVESGSGTMDCPVGTVCTFGVLDTNLDDKFIAVASPGWHFVRWQAGTGFLCGNLANNVCVVNNTAFAGNADIEAVIATGAKFYALPVFEPDVAGNPITDTVVANGREWAQPNLFAGLSWAQIKVACPAGSCTGVLNGYSMDGWNWASATVIASLFSYYTGNTSCNPTCDGAGAPAGSMQGPIADGFIPNISSPPFVGLGGRFFGASATTSGAYMYDQLILTELFIGVAYSPPGAWFYR